VIFDSAKLWIPNTKDVASGLYAQRWIYVGTVTAATALVGSNVNDAAAIVPPDKVRIIQGVSCEFVTQGTETCVQIMANLFPAGGGQAIAQFGLPRDWVTVASANNIGVCVPIGCFAFPLEVVGITATKSAAASNATLQFTFWGYDVPRGNIQG
jgi:hypothetical protein